MPLSLISDRQLELVIRTLPGAPRMLAQLSARLQALDTDIADVTAMLRRDQGLTARLIDMANSAAYMGMEPATTIEDAVARVGFSETYRIIGAVASGQLADEPLSYYGIAPRRLRENSLFCAVMMEQLADPGQLGSGTAYTIGLLRSIGKVVLDRYAREMPGTPYLDPTRESLVEWERANWGVTNAQVAARVLELWEFPAAAIETVRHHLAPADGSPREAFVLNLAAGAAEVHGLGLPGEHGLWSFHGEGFARARVDEVDVQLAAERAATVVQRISVAFA